MLDPLPQGDPAEWWMRGVEERLRKLEQRRYDVGEDDEATFAPSEVVWQPTIGTFNVTTLAVVTVTGSLRNFSTPGWWIVNAVIDYRQGAASTADVFIPYLAVDGSSGSPNRRAVVSMLNVIQTRFPVPLPPALFKVEDGQTRTVSLQAQLTNGALGATAAIETGATTLTAHRIAD